MTTTIAAPTIALPTEKTPRHVGWKGKPFLIFGRKKIGKSTLAAQLDPDKTVFITTPGQSGLEVYEMQVQSWEHFLLAGQQLRDVEHHYEIVVVDIVDDLARMCAEHVIKGLAAGERLDPKKFVHVSDFPYGKGYEAIAEEFRLRVAKLCSLGMTVVFISHEKESTVRTRTGGEIQKFAPDVGSRGMREWLLGFVDFIFYATVMQTKDGQERVLQVKPSESVEAGARFPFERQAKVPEFIPLTAEALKATLEGALA